MEFKHDTNKSVLTSRLCKRGERLSSVQVQSSNFDINFVFILTVLREHTPPPPKRTSFDWVFNARKGPVQYLEEQEEELDVFRYIQVTSCTRFQVESR